MYPLRPELFESTYLLYRATGNRYVTLHCDGRSACRRAVFVGRYYQRVGAELLLDLKEHAQAPCGFATLHDVMDKSQEDRMESFFLSETLVGCRPTTAPLLNIDCMHACRSTSTCCLTTAILSIKPTQQNTCLPQKVTCCQSWPTFGRTRTNMATSHKSSTVPQTALRNTCWLAQAAIAACLLANE